jgi:hypothetical protein
MATLNEVYQKFGEVSEAAQLLETELGTQLLIIRGVEQDMFAGDNGELATEIQDKINKSTLGQVLKQLGNSVEFPGALDLLLANALTERNHLFHSFYRKHNFRRNSDEGRGEMIADLERKHEIILKAYKVMLRLSGIESDKLVAMPLPTEHVKI